MTDPLISVRGDARRTVPPDLGTLHAAITVSRESKAAALRAAATAQEDLVAALVPVGGVPLTPDTERRPLTWTAHAATTRVEAYYDDATRTMVPTGQVVATVLVVVLVRTFDLLDRLGAALADQNLLNVLNVGWYVDPDNPAWPAVRAAAIHAAVAKARDYAAALGGTVDRLEHLADVGLLGGEQGPAAYALRSATFAGAPGGVGDEGAVPSLDPVPQELVASVDARFVAVGVALP